MKAASTPFKKKKKQSGVWLTLLPLYLFTLVFVAGPLVYMFVLSFQTRAEVWGVVNQFTLDNYKNIFQPVYLNTFVESFKLALTSTLLICAIGYPFGYFMAKLLRAVEKARDAAAHDPVLDQLAHPAVRMDHHFPCKRYAG